MGGWIEQLRGQRAVFAVPGAPAIVLSLLMRFTVKEPPHGRFDGPRPGAGPIPSPNPVHAPERWPAALGRLLWTGE